jgi:hypothetical protein
MSQLIIANVAAPFVLSQTGSIWLFVSIIPVEMLVVFLCLKFSGIAINFSRLFRAVLVANIMTTMLGIFLISGPTSASLDVIGLSLLIGFMFSFSIEAVIYAVDFKNSSFELSNCQIILFSLLSNLASYMIFVSALTSLNYDNAGSPFLTPNPQRVVRELRRYVIPAYINIQTAFYYNKKRFIYNREELNEISNISEEENKRLFANKRIFEENTKKDSLLDRVYLLDIQGDKTTANLTVTSKRKDFTSCRLTIFKDNDKFIKGICETDLPSMTAPEIPPLVGSKVLCPLGASDKSDKFGLSY